MVAVTIREIRFIDVLPDYLGRDPPLSRDAPVSRVRSVDPEELFESRLRSPELDGAGCGSGVLFTVGGGVEGSGAGVLPDDCGCE